MLEFRAAHLPDKYWHRRSVVVPKKKMGVDSRFKTLNDLFRNFDERENFEIFWIEYGVTGNVRLPGELNYCWITSDQFPEGRFFHLEKVQNEGFFDNGGHEENVWSYYMEYDDWQNDWLNNGVQIKGTISKTGDWELARANIVQLAPLIQGCSAFKTFRSEEDEEDEEDENLADLSSDVLWTHGQFTTIIHPKKLDKFLEGLKQLPDRVYNRPMETNELVIPLIIRSGSLFNPTTPISLGHEMVKLLNTEPLSVYDLKKTNLNFAYLKAKYRLDGLYAIAPKGRALYEVSESENPHLRIKKGISFSGLKEIRYLNLDFHEIPFSYTKMEDYWNKLLTKFPNLTDDQKNRFRFVVTRELHKIFSYSMGFEKIDERLQESLFIEDARPQGSHISWSNVGEQDQFEREEIYELFKSHLFRPSPMISRNFLVPPGTDRKWLYFLINIRHLGDVNITDPQTIDGKNWTVPRHLATNDIHHYVETMKWIATQTRRPYIILQGENAREDDDHWQSYLFKKSYSGNERTKGILGCIPPWRSLYYDPRPTSSLYSGLAVIPDYATKQWVLAFFYPVFELFFTKHYGIQGAKLLAEIAGKGTVTEDWKRPDSDLFLGTSGSSPLRSCERFALLIPCLVRWQNGWKWAENYYGEKYCYYFSGRRRRRVRIQGQEAAKPLCAYFQFPINGAGFDIVKHLEKYRNASDDIVRWNYVATDDYKRTHNLVDKGGEFLGYWGIINEGSQPKAMSDLTKDNHPCLNNLVEIRLDFSGAEARKIFSKLIMELWSWFVFKPWDSAANGHTRGAIPIRNGGHDTDGYLGIDWARPFHKVWYMFGVFVRNWAQKSIGDGEDREIKFGSSPYWKPAKQTWIIPWSGQAYPAIQKNVDIFPILHNHFGWWKFTEGLTQENPWRATSSNWQVSDYDVLVRAIHDPDRERPWELFEVGGRETSTGNVRRLSNMLEGKTYTTKRRFNPTTIEWDMETLDEINLPENLREELKATLKPLEVYKELGIPLFIWDVINPDNPTSRFKNLNYTGQDWEKKLVDELDREYTNALKILNNKPFVVDLVGTQFMAFCKLESSGRWLFELISKTNECFEKVDTKHQVFTNMDLAPETEEGFIQRVNSAFEVVVYGQRIPLKTRPDTTKDRLDIGFKITPIHDDKQTTTSVWYLVEINADQDTHRTRIEVAKNLNAMSNISAYEREEILRTMAYHAKDRQTEQMQLRDEREKYSFDMDLKEQRLDVNRRREVIKEGIGMAQTALQTAQAIGYGAGSWNPAGWASAGAAAVAGGVAMAGQASNMIHSKQLHEFNMQEHAMHAAHGARALEYRGDLMASKHELAKGADRLALYNMQNNISYPANSDALMFRQENAQLGLSDVYLTQFYPDGRQLEFLVKYYREYGYNLVVPDQVCFGVDWIRRHIQFAKITSNVHPNETVRRMIEERALNGITLEDNDDWHADKITNPVADFKPRRGKKKRRSG